ncbi:MAG: hypothetical protein ABJF04_10165 [Reichenbachiella sp.]|uniref:hypothetical protein n=1 Tax=Reichenbachiella sp. TaxID=2184521 RepID=UPI00326739A0
MKSIFSVLWLLCISLSISSCTKKEPCPDFRSYFLDYYPVTHGDELIFKNLTGSSETKVIVFSMRVEHVSDIKQNVINGKSTCQCWSKMTFGFELPDSELKYSIDLNSYDGITSNSMDVAVERASGFSNTFYEEYNTDEIEKILESHALPFEDYRIFSSDTGAGLVFERGVSIVLIRLDDGDTWVINNISNKKPFNWDNIHYEEFVTTC